jgi:hypothetical protein
MGKLVKSFGLGPKVFSVRVRVAPPYEVIMLSELDYIKLWMFVNNLKASEAAKKRGYKMDPRIEAAKLK